MAKDAFALSPISARAAQPSEEDYEAINQAFMETSRGRWFLGEYAKRNRNADTRMVLDAVARIEETIAAQEQPAPAPETGLVEALAAIRSALDEARVAAVTALNGLALEQHLAPVRKGTRVIREISWRWREIGADARICDLIDSQVGAIEAGCDQISAADAQNGLSAAFDLIANRVADFDDGDTAPPQSTEQAGPAPSAAPSKADAAVAELAADMIVTDYAEATDGVVALPAETAGAMSEVMEATADATEVTSEADDADDEAVLDLIAQEMAAPDVSDKDDALSEAIFRIDSDEAYVVEKLAAADLEFVHRPEAAVAPAPAPEVPAAVRAAPQPSSPPPSEASLGSSLLASGILQRPKPSQSDPLASIRRLSQAEKIAFFS